MNNMFQKKLGGMDVEKPKYGIAKLTNRPYIVTDVKSSINQVNIGSDHRMIVNIIKLEI